MNHAEKTPWDIVGLGEVLWDIFPDETRFGGAPANFACGVAALSSNVNVHMVSGVGDDELGRQARRELQQRCVLTTNLQTHLHQTGTVNIRLTEERNAEYVFGENTAWDNLQWIDEMSTLADTTDVVCFGTLGQRNSVSAATIQRFVERVPDTSLKLFDINLRPPFYSDDIIRKSLSLANVLKLNEEELDLVTQLSGLSGKQDEVLPDIADRWQLATIVLTLGADGAMLLHEGNVISTPNVETEVVDTVGAGDSFTAALTIGLLNGWPIDKVALHATQVAAFVCSQRGATPEFPNQLMM